jgi:hypothetical protein
MTSSITLAPRKKPQPVVRVVYTLKAANGNFLITKDAKNITVKY